MTKSPTVFPANRFCRYPLLNGWLGGIALVGLAMVMPRSALTASPWQIIKVDGHDYLTVENVSKFYGLPLGASRVEKVSNIDVTRQTMDQGGAELQFSSGSREVIINGARNWLSFPVAAKDGHLLVSRLDLAKTLEPQLRPQMIPNVGKIKTVVLDPGHGGYDKGACNGYGCEKDYALDVARQLRPLLQARGLRVLLTREGDYFVPLEVRARIANAAKDSVFVSIHFNATDNDPAATGLEIYSLTPLGAPSTSEDWVKETALSEQNGTGVDAQSLALSSSIYHSMLGQIGEFDRGIKRARFAVLRLTKVPAVLIEGGFITERHESQLIANKDWRSKLAVAISMGIDNYRSLADRRQKPLLVRDYSRARLAPQPELFPVDVKLQPTESPMQLSIW
jgi:N-acetylmuramoyl-L-alanine amidase